MGGGDGLFRNARARPLDGERAAAVVTAVQSEGFDIVTLAGG